MSTDKKSFPRHVKQNHSKLKVVKRLNFEQRLGSNLKTSLPESSSKHNSFAGKQLSEVNKNRPKNVDKIPNKIPDKKANPSSVNEAPVKKAQEKRSAKTVNRQPFVSDWLETNEQEFQKKDNLPYSCSPILSSSFFTKRSPTSPIVGNSSKRARQHCPQKSASESEAVPCFSSLKTVPEDQEKNEDKNESSPGSHVSRSPILGGNIFARKLERKKLAREKRQSQNETLKSEKSTNSETRKTEFNKKSGTGKFEISREFEKTKFEISRQFEKTKFEISREFEKCRKSEITGVENRRKWEKSRCENNTTLKSTKKPSISIITTILDDGSSPSIIDDETFFEETEFEIEATQNVETKDLQMFEKHHCFQMIVKEKNKGRDEKSLKEDFSPSQIIEELGVEEIDEVDDVEEIEIEELGLEKVEEVEEIEETQVEEVDDVEEIEETQFEEVDDVEEIEVEELEVDLEVDCKWRKEAENEIESPRSDYSSKVRNAMKIENDNATIIDEETDVEQTQSMFIEDVDTPAIFADCVDKVAEIQQNSTQISNLHNSPEISKSQRDSQDTFFSKAESRDSQVNPVSQKISQVSSSKVNYAVGWIQNAQPSQKISQGSCSQINYPVGRYSPNVHISQVSSLKNDCNNSNDVNITNGENSSPKPLLENFSIFLKTEKKKRKVKKGSYGAKLQTLVGREISYFRMWHHQLKQSNLQSNNSNFIEVCIEKSYIAYSRQFAECCLISDKLDLCKDLFKSDTQEDAHHQDVHINQVIKKQLTIMTVPEIVGELKVEKGNVLKVYHPWEILDKQNLTLNITYFTLVEKSSLEICEEKTVEEVRSEKIERFDCPCIHEGKVVENCSLKNVNTKPNVIHEMFKSS